MMNDRSDFDLSLYKNLQALSDLSFPKQCKTCGQRFETVEEFISQTESLQRSSGFQEGVYDDNRIILELFRNCTCGSTLMDEFNNRRNLSPAGIKRRKKFGELVERLTKSGFSPETIRSELLKIMAGEGSKLLKVKPVSGKKGLKHPRPEPGNP
jgi:hypothetical protein